jgi:ATPase family associated with various cellular activities (AAA)
LNSAAKWREASQNYLRAALDVLLLRLQRSHEALSRPRDTGQGADLSLDISARYEAAFQQSNAALRIASEALPAPSPLHVLAETFELSAFEQDVILLCTGMELDSRFIPLCEYPKGVSQTHVTFGVAMDVLEGAHWSALTPAAPLRYWRLVEVGPGNGLTSSPLRIDERILHFLSGEGSSDERLPLLSLLRDDNRELATHELPVMYQILSAWQAADIPLIHLHGGLEGQRRRIVRSASVAEGTALRVMRSSALPADTIELNNLLRLWNREALLHPLVLLLELEEGAEERTIAFFASRAAGRIVIGSRDRSTLRELPALLIEVSRASEAMQSETWRLALGEDAAGLETEIDKIVYQFNLPDHVIEAAGESLRTFALPGESIAAKGERLWDFCRLSCRSDLERLVERVKSSAGWSDLILPAAELMKLHEIVQQIRHRHQVYGNWGYGLQHSRGLGITALFAGASGTGKTLAAEVLANDLHIDLYRVDLSSIVSKFIGETEKNLSRVFDAAERAGAVLLFDEADALYGKRSEVKDSHDRFANLQVSYLLQKMETYRGLAILTSNLKQSLDPAFIRRLRFVVDFPFPAAAERAAIWARCIPAETPAEGIDVVKLARLNMAGGSIRNIALSAAFLAVEDGGVLGMRHLLRAARAESVKLESSLSDADTRDWV